MIQDIKESLPPKHYKTFKKLAIFFVIGFAGLVVLDKIYAIRANRKKIQES